MGSLPPERMLPVARRLWGKAGVDDALLPLLARQAQPEDRDKFLKALGTFQPQAIRYCLDALEKLSPSTGGPELLPSSPAIEPHSSRDPGAPCAAARAGW